MVVATPAPNPRETRMSAILDGLATAGRIYAVLAILGSLAFIAFITVGSAVAHWWNVRWQTRRLFEEIDVRRTAMAAAAQGYRFNGTNTDGRKLTGWTTTETPGEIAQRFFDLGCRDLVVIPLAGGPVCAGVEKNSKGEREWWADK
jgi:hypothetical protein